MKILYFFPEKSVIMHQWQRTHFIDELLRNQIDLRIMNPLLFNSFDEANEKLIDELKKGGYDLFFTNLCGNGIIWNETLIRIKELGIPSLSFRGDNLLWAYNDKDTSKYFDLVWLTSIETKYLYDKWGVNTMFAPYAANPYTFMPCKEKVNIDKACFVGTPYGSRSIMVNTLTKAGLPVDVYCIPPKSERTNEDTAVKILNMPDMSKSTMINTFKFKEGRRLIWGAFVNKIIGENKLVQNNALTKKNMVKASEQPDLYSRYRLSLATTSAGNTDVLKRNLHVINLRGFEIPMSGGLQICRYSQELASYFEEDKEVLFYRSKEEYVDKARFYLEKASDEEIFRMKAAARKRAEKEHTWMKRFELAFNKLGIKSK